MLTPAQLKVFNAISRHLFNTGSSPSLAVLGNKLKTTKVSVFHHVENIIAKGYLKKEPNKAQSISIVKYPPGATSPSLDQVVYNPEQAASLRAAYARGVAAERARLLAASDSDPIQKLAIEKAHAAGVKQGADQTRGVRSDQYAKGLAAGRAERTREMSKSYQDGYRQCMQDYSLTNRAARA